VNHLIELFLSFQTFDSDHYQTSATFIVCCFLSLYQVRIIFVAIRTTFTKALMQKVKLENYNNNNQQFNRHNFLIKFSLI